jgi:hypothetical protein
VEEILLLFGDLFKDWKYIVTNGSKNMIYIALKSCFNAYYSLVCRVEDLYGSQVQSLKNCSTQPEGTVSSPLYRIV